MMRPASSVRETDGHFGEHGRIAVGQDAESFRVPLAEQSGAHVTLPVQRVAAFALAARVNVRDGQAVRSLPLGRRFYPAAK